MARSKTIGKGKAPSSSMERTMKKRKFDTSQTIKKGKGKRRDSSSESEEASETGGGGGGGGQRYRYWYHLCKKGQWAIGTGAALTGTGTVGRNFGILFKPFFCTPFPFPISSTFL